jgi:MFS family permease
MVLGSAASLAEGGDVGPVSAAVRASSTSLAAEIGAGLRYLWSNTLLRVLALIVAVMNLGWSAWLAVLVLHAVEPGPMGLSTVEYGLLLTGLGVGGLAGTVLAGPILNRIGRRWAILTDILGTVMLVGAPAVTTNV